MSTPFEPIKTADVHWQDGMPYASEFHDIYFSRENGLAEARHVFINGNQLIQRWQALDPMQSECFVIAETGFGSGLNFLITCFLWQQYAPANAHLHYFSCEKYPLSHADLARCLRLWPELKTIADELLRHYPILTPGFHTLKLFEDRHFSSATSQTVSEKRGIQLTLMLGDAYESYQQLLTCGNHFLERELNATCVDAWFLDGFAPRKNPHMWQQDLFSVMALLSNEHTTLATFSAASEVRRRLVAAGFNIRKQPGFGKKREMVTGQFVGPSESIKKPHTPWQATKPKKSRRKTALVLGAGLSGCFTANALAMRGWKVTVIDKHLNPGAGASGNSQAVVYPNLSAYRSPLTEFFLTSYLYATRIYQSLLAQHKIGELKGILQLAFNDQESQAQQGLRNWLSYYPDLGHLVSKEEASQHAGIQINRPGVWLPKAGWLNSQALCRVLCQGSDIDFVGGVDVKNPIFDNDQWIINDYHAEVLVLASGHQANQLEQTKDLPFKPIRGQLTSVSSNTKSVPLRIPLCAKGHVLPELDGTHVIGATYHLGHQETDCYACDDQLNLAKLKEMPIELEWSEQIVHSWSGVRATTPDYLPVIGPVIRSDEFAKQYALLATNSKRWIPASAPCFPGLYVCAGFGSRGLTTIPLSTEWLASLINQDANILPRRLIQAVSPARFLFKTLIRRLNQTK